MRMVLSPTPIETPRKLRARARDGLELCLERHRPDSAPLNSLCLAHGFGQTRLAWARSAQLLAAQGYEVISADARGHGDSARNPVNQRYDFQQFVDDVVAVAEQTVHPKPVWVGASMGGLLGLMASVEAASSPFSGSARSAAFWSRTARPTCCPPSGSACARYGSAARCAAALMRRRLM